MGNRVSACVQGRTRGPGDAGSIVPHQDPLFSSTNIRVQRCELTRDFDLQTKVLGTGWSGAVRLATAKGSGQQVAVKQFSKGRLPAHRLQLLQSEVEVYMRLDHPNICRLLHAYEAKNDVSLVMELCGCELYTRLCERKVYREADAADAMLQMMQAVGYLHAHNIVHRDLKLENWMYGATDRDDRLKLIDFGFSRVLSSADETLDMPCGTLLYTSPEVLSRRYTSKCDIWSLGVIGYMLLVGAPPFWGQNKSQIAKAIIQDDFPKHKRWANLSGDAQDFVVSLLQKDAAKRPDATEALGHQWLAAAADQASVQGGGEIGVDVLTNLANFARGTHLQRAALTMLAFSLTSRELQDLEDTFLAFDKSGRGTITLDKLADVMQGQMEFSSEDVERIFHSMDFSNDEELHYTPFIAAMIASRIKLHEDKVRAAFDSFDRDGSGFITAEGLTKIFDGLCGKPLGPGSMQGRGLTQEEAEQWIREVDYKGNGVIDYDGFVWALMGKKLWRLPTLDEDADAPMVKVFETEYGGQAHGMNDSFCDTLRPSCSLTRASSSVFSSRMSQDFAARSPTHTSSSLSSWRTSQETIGRSPTKTSMSRVDSRMSHDIAGLSRLTTDEDEEDRRAQSFQAGCKVYEAKVQVRTVSCDIDEMHFA